jgi:hypothetical protein
MARVGCGGIFFGCLEFLGVFSIVLMSMLEHGLCIGLHEMLGACCEVSKYFIGPAADEFDHWKGNMGLK